MSSWSIILPFNPVATPRPNFRYLPKNNRVITYYSDKTYPEYLSSIHNYIELQNKYNEEFYNIIHSDLGVITSINFYCAVPKTYTRIHNVMKTSTPDIDNLLKASLDGIFNGLVEKDSRVVGVKALKFNELSNPRTEITLTSVDDILAGKAELGNIMAFKGAKTSWSTTLPFAPLGTPRPQYTAKKTSEKAHTFHSADYSNYLKSVEHYLNKQHLYTENFYEAINSENGMLLDVNYYCKTPKNQKNFTKLMKLTAPDIDNLLKATMDGIFNPLKVKDSRIVGVKALKFNELSNPRTEVTLLGF